MSGLKYSEIQLEQERKAREQEIERIERLQREFQVASSGAEKLLSVMNPEVLATFPETESMAARLREAKLPERSNSMDSQSLKELGDTIESYCEEANTLQQQLIDIRDHGRDKKARELLGRIEVARNRVTVMGDLLDKWQRGEREKCCKTLDGFEHEVNRDKFVTVRDRMNVFEARLSELDKDCSTLEAQDRQRRVVLDAILAVCDEMGWGIEDEPRLENDLEPGSAMLFTVNTFSDGMMPFRLSLEGIKVEAPFGTEKGACYSQFDDFSDSLRKYGVKTKFKRIDGPEDLPEDRTDDAVNPPQEELKNEMEAR